MLFRSTLVGTFIFEAELKKYFCSSGVSSSDMLRDTLLAIMFALEQEESHGLAKRFLFILLGRTRPESRIAPRVSPYMIFCFKLWILASATRYS